MSLSLHLNSALLQALPPPARYYPFEKGLYEVAPALKRFGMSFGNAELDEKMFQFDSRFEEYRQSKLACRADRLSKYYLEHDHPAEVAAGIARLIITRLTQESPELFGYESMASGESALFCRLTGETLLFDGEMKLLPESTTQVRYESAFDALAMQVQEDLNVLRVGSESEGGSDWLSAIHVCAPSTWKPEEKVGKSFIGIHDPVPTSENMLKAAKGIVQAMIHKGPYVRFNWGLTGNPRPNHYPDAPPGMTQEEWRGKPVKTIGEGTEVYMWVERQIVWGCPEVNASLFTIRPLFVPLRDIRADESLRERFIASLSSMVPAIREYKGLDEAMEPVLAWMREGAAQAHPAAQAQLDAQLQTEAQPLTTHVPLPARQVSDAATI
jgi:hypothetical protein